MDLSAVESRIKDAVHSVLTGLEGAEPGIEDGVATALMAAGAPAPIATAAKTLLSELLNHFRGPVQETETPVPAATASPVAVVRPAQ